MSVPPRERRGSILVLTVVFVSILLSLGAAIASMAQSRARAFQRQVRAPLDAREAGQAAHMLMYSCLEQTWDGAPGRFQSAFQDCAGGIDGLRVGNVDCSFDWGAPVGDQPPYALRVAIECAGAP